MTLIAGSVLFAAPFAWLASTSAKAPDELYPPRWLPPAPDRVAESPYIALRENERATKPLKVAPEDWDRLKKPILACIASKVGSLGDHLPEFYAPFIKHAEISEAIFARLLPRAPDELFEKVEPVCTAWFEEHVTEEVVRDAFDLAYRRLALSEVEFIGYDARREKPLAGCEIDWKVVEGDARLVVRRSGLRREAQEVHYGFAKMGKFTLEAVLPLEMPVEALRKVRVAYHGDRSWHRLEADIEVAGRGYRAKEAAYLNTERWQDVTWRLPGDEVSAVMIKTWKDAEEAGPSGFAEAGKVRLRLRFRYSSGLRALVDKGSFNFREVIRQVPLWGYVRNSVFLVVMNIAGQVLGSSLVAFAFSRLRWPGREFCFVLVLASLMIPPQVTLIPVFLIWKELGFYNTLVPLYVPAFFGSAFYIFLLRQFMRTIPADLEDSAKIDGCGFFGIYARIILPLIKPALATIAIFTFMAVWNDFMGPLIFVADQELYPLSLGLFALHAVMLIFARHELMMAAAVLMTIPVIVLFFVAQRQFIQGITLTGLKG